MNLFGTPVNVAPEQAAEPEFTVIEHVGLPGENGIFNESIRTTCPHTASKQFDRLKFDSNPLTASISLFKGDELVKFWSPESL